MEMKRMTAVKTKISPVVSGRFVRQDGLSPNYVITAMGERLSRIRILGTVVNKFVSEDKNFASITIDDASSTIRARVFRSLSLVENIGTGDIVDVIGKIKEYQGEVYIIPEIIKPVDDPNMEILRELELRKKDEILKEKRKIILEYQKQAADMGELKSILEERFGFREEEIEAVLSSSVEDTDEGSDDSKQKILELIEKLDKGGGCDYSELLKTAGVQEDVIDSIINDLLTEGACFEPRPGKIKKL